MATKYELQNILEEIRRHDIQLVRFELSDFYAISHHRGVLARHFKEKVENGLPITKTMLSLDPLGKIVGGTGYAEETNYGDALFIADLSTFQVIPWKNKTARVLITPYETTPEKGPVKGYPRHIAKRQLSRLKSLGYSLLSAHEYEFYVVDAKNRQPVTSGFSLRNTVETGETQKFLDQIRDHLPQVGVDLEVIEKEYGPGQFEIPFKPAFGIRAADNGFTFKTSIKEIARQHDLIASFMSAPYNGVTGSSGHFNHSLWTEDGTNSVMYDDKSATGLSEVAEQWIAGILRHMPALIALCSSTVNCYSRLRSADFIPTYASWGVDNRTCAIRIKTYREGRYIEDRTCPAAACPYTSLASVVAAGLDGIKRKMKLPPGCDKSSHYEGNLPPHTARLPVTMEAALQCLLKDDVITEAMGPEFIKCFFAQRTNEIALHNEAIASGRDEFEWARDYYFKYL